MYETIGIYCPNCGLKSPVVRLESDTKSKKKVLFICAGCKTSLLLKKVSDGEITISCKQDGYYTKHSVSC